MRFQQSTNITKIKRDNHSSFTGLNQELYHSRFIVLSIKII